MFCSSSVQSLNKFETLMFLFCCFFFYRKCKQYCLKYCLFWNSIVTLLTTILFSPGIPEILLQSTKETNSSVLLFFFFVFAFQFHFSTILHTHVWQFSISSTSAVASLDHREICELLVVKIVSQKSQLHDPLFTK